MELSFFAISLLFSIIYVIISSEVKYIVVLLKHNLKPLPKTLYAYVFLYDGRFVMVTLPNDLQDYNVQVWIWLTHMSFVSIKKVKLFSKSQPLTQTFQTRLLRTMALLEVCL